MNPDTKLRQQIEKRTPPAPSTSAAALDICISADILDLHVESFSFQRTLGYNPAVEHSQHFMGGFLYGHADLPRLRLGGIKGATWVLTGNPLRPAEDRLDALRRLLNSMRKTFADSSVPVRWVNTSKQYHEARKAGQHAAFWGVQGAHLFPPDPGCLEEFAPELQRITLVHMTESLWGASSTPNPLRPFRNILRGSNKSSDPNSKDILGPSAPPFIEEMNRLKVGVDLAHLHPVAFQAALNFISSGCPPLVSHTGLKSIYPHFRNISDQQVKLIADKGGLIGIMYHSLYLGDGLFKGRLETLVRHIAHGVRLVGAKFIGLGSDWDGLICTPRDFRTAAEFPVLVQALLEEIGEDDTLQVIGLSNLAYIDRLKGLSA